MDFLKTLFVSVGTTECVTASDLWTLRGLPSLAPSLRVSGGYSHVYETRKKTDTFCMSFERGFISTYNKISSWLGSVNLRYSDKFIINKYIKARKFVFFYIEDHRSAIQ